MYFDIKDSLFFGWNFLKDLINGASSNYVGLLFNLCNFFTNLNIWARTVDLILAFMLCYSLRYLKIVTYKAFIDFIYFLFNCNLI